MNTGLILISGIIFVAFLGMLCIIIDIFYAKEEDPIIRRSIKPPVSYQNDSEGYFEDSIHYDSDDGLTQDTGPY